MPHEGVFSAIFKQQFSSQLDEAGAGGQKSVGHLELIPLIPFPLTVWKTPALNNMTPFHRQQLY